MISRRLTKIQKDEIVAAYRCGQNTNTLAEEYNCTSNTINRTVKSVLSDSEYKLLKGKRLKSFHKKEETVNKKSLDSKKEDFEEPTYCDSPQAKVIEEEQSIKTDNQLDNSDFEEIAFLPMEDISLSERQNHKNSDIEKSNLDTNNDFEEIVPLASNFDVEKKELDFEIVDQEILPESVYMLVDKKVELEVKSISDLPEWSFLPENELKRNAILLFSNQRTAKRICSRNQRVIKIPNSNVFQVSKSYLLSKGITRLILEDYLIALDN
tara:strand:- start:340 stop:1140 length:801 start_codon:yes stop_codon:yes gene_type:complete